MESIRAGATVICVAATVVAMIKNFIPSSGFEKTMRLLLGSFAVLSITMFLKTTVTELPSITQKSFNVETDYNQKAEQIMSDQLAQMTEARLRENEIETKVINAEVKIDDENGIYVHSVCIEISKEFKNRETDIRRIVEKETGIEPEIVFASEE